VLWLRVPALFRHGVAAPCSGIVLRCRVGALFSGPGAIPGRVPVAPGPRGGPDRVRSASVSRAPQRRRDHRGPGRRAWWRVRAGAAGLAALALVSGCGLIGGPKTISANVPDQMTVTSQAFSSHLFPAAYTCHGPGQHPSLHWSGAPEGTKSLALLVDDASAPIKPYIYWIVFDIGPQTTGIQAGQVPPGALQADNSKGTDRYDPPCPLNGLHTYRFTVYALSRSLTLPEGVAMKTAWSAIAQAAIARGRLQTTASP
jgi:Raf kinase inhibitor-like YbhB/YbcL family protein